MPLYDSDLATEKAFINAHDRITRQINADLAAAGPPGPQLDTTRSGRCARARAAAGGWASSREAVVLSRTAIVRLVDRLEKAGLARREPVPEDRRGAYVV